jgi:hypothetical protein
MVAVMIVNRGMVTYDTVAMEKFQSEKIVIVIIPILLMVQKYVIIILQLEEG